MTGTAVHEGASAAFILRDMTPDDLEGVLCIERDSFRSPWTEGMFLEEISSWLCVSRVALIDDRLAGYSCFSLVLEEVHLRNIAVDAACRGRGVASKLMADMIRVSLERGAVSATLEVRPSNSEAVGLYRRFGFRVAGVRPRYYADTREDALIMWADLDREKRARIIERTGTDEKVQGR